MFIHLLVDLTTLAETDRQTMNTSQPAADVITTEAQDS